MIKNLKKNNEEFIIKNQEIIENSNGYYKMKTKYNKNFIENIDILHENMDLKKNWYH